MLGAHPAQRERVLERALRRAEPAGEVGVEDRPVPGRAHLVDDRFVAPPDADLLAVDRERLPRVLVARRGALVVQPFEVEVLHVPADVGRTPRVVRRRAEDDAGRERRGDAARLVAGRAEVQLDPGARLLHEQMGVVREQRPAGGGPRPCDRPLVGPLAPRGAGELAEQVARQAAGRRGRGMAPQRRPERWKEAAGRLLAQLGGEMDTEELHVPVARQGPREHRPAGAPGGVVRRAGRAARPGARTRRVEPASRRPRRGPPRGTSRSSPATCRPSRRRSSRPRG